jgi:AmiR/NasT family two-component response regulator
VNAWGPSYHDGALLPYPCTLACGKDLDVAIRVVIAEDEAIIRLDLREILEEEGYEVVGETGRGDQAVELCRALQPDVAVLDIKMPGLTGIEVARELSSDRTCAVVMLTAFSQRDVIADATEAGALAYLVKPFQKNDLVPAIELAIARHREVVELAQEVQSLEEELETRKVVDRAKGVLMDRHGMTEGEAFAWIQRRAMSERTRKRVVAERIVSGELVP